MCLSFHIQFSLFLRRQGGKRGRGVALQWATQYFSKENLRKTTCNISLHIKGVRVTCHI